MATVNVQGTDEFGNLVVKVMDAEDGLSAARRARLYEAAPDLLAALQLAAAAFAVMSNQLDEGHPGRADADKLGSVQAFALENFHEAQAAIAEAS